MMKQLVWIAAAALLVLTGCFGSSDEAAESTDPQEVEEGVDVSKDPFGALSAMKDLGSELEQLQQDLESAAEVEAIHFSELIETLPEPPSGWTASDAEGKTSQMGSVKVSNAKRVYTEDGDGCRVTLEVTDGAYSKMVYLPLIMASKFSEESTAGYKKGITVDGSPGFEQYTFNSKRGERSLMHEKRYIVRTVVEGCPQESIGEWAGRVGVDELPSE